MSQTAVGVHSVDPDGPDVWAERMVRSSAHLADRARAEARLESARHLSHTVALVEGSLMRSAVAVDRVAGPTV